MLKNLMESSFRWNPLVVKGSDDDLHLKREITEDDCIDRVAQKMQQMGYELTRDDLARGLRCMDEVFFEELQKGRVIEYWKGRLYILPSVTPDGYYEIYSPDPQLQEAFENSIFRLKFRVRH
jgi:hypothetical protein